MSKHQPIEPKPTTYGGVLFRSRLEARWAVFLDFTENVLNWEYEPDFRIKLFRDDKSPMTAYLEVKPQLASKNYKENLGRFVHHHKLTLILAQGDFYGDDSLDITVIRTASATPVRASELFKIPERGMYHASHFRFDLKG